MKFKFYFPLLLLSCTLMFSSCMEDKCEREITYVTYNPIYFSVDEIRADISLSDPQALKKPGKIYYYNDFLFINEQKQGVHIFDNTNPESPVKIGFYKIPGNVDIAIANDLLYADNYMDLVTIDISDIYEPQTAYRVEDAFENYYYLDPNTNILTDYVQEEVTEIVDCNDVSRGWGWELDISGPINSSGVFTDGGNFSTGTGGSLARFTINQGHLYIIDHVNLHVYDLLQEGNPNKVNEVGVTWQIETIFPYNDKLFIGSTTGLFVMDASNPAEPYHLSSYAHAFACDPVYVKAPYAYVTLRSDQNWCQQGLNQLDLVDISEITDIKLEKSFPMENPRGLSIRDENLFICEGDAGLKVFDINDPLTLDENRIAHVKNIKSTDIITLPGERNLMLVIGEDGFYQYDGTDPTDPELLSRILIEK